MPENQLLAQPASAYIKGEQAGQAQRLREEQGQRAQAQEQRAQRQSLFSREKEGLVLEQLKNKGDIESRQAKAKKDSGLLNAILQLPESQQQQGFQALSPRLEPDIVEMFTDNQGQVRFDPKRATLLRNIGVQFAQAKPSALQQQLEGAYPGDKAKHQEIQRQLIEKKLAPSKPLVEVNVGNKGEELKKIAGVQAKRYGKIVDDAENARDLLDNINQLQSIDVETGALEPTKAAFAAVAKGAGFNDLANSIANVTNAQALRAVSNRMVNTVLNAAKGPQTEGDAKRALSTIQGLGDDPKAGAFKTNALKSVALRKIEQSEFIDARIETGMSFTESNKEWNQYKRDTPSLSATIKGPDGLPVFYFQFKENAQQVRPDITEDQIIEAWRRANK